MTQDQKAERMDRVPYGCMVGKREIGGGASVAFPLTERVRALWGAGYSASAIAIEIGFRSPSTRGAAHVLHIVGAEK
jgi:hypothetical protein